MGMYFLNALRQLRHCDNKEVFMGKLFEIIFATKERQSATSQICRNESLCCRKFIICYFSLWKRENLSQCRNCRRESKYANRWNS